MTILMRHLKGLWMLGSVPDLGVLFAERRGRDGPQAKP